jgi:hypothetical protein
VIRVFDNPAITWTLTAVLLLGGSYNLLQARNSHRPTERINNALHAVMHLVMAAMLWNLVPSALLAQILFLAGAALWFLIQAVAHPEFTRLCAGRGGRMKCLYHSLTMLGAALMVAMMGHVTGASQGIGSAQGMSMPMGHHHATETSSSATSAGMTDHTSTLALPLTVLFAAAAAVFIFLLLRSLTAKGSRCETTARRLSVSAEHVIEALGAAVMAVMFGAMSA